MKKQKFILEFSILTILGFMVVGGLFLVSKRKETKVVLNEASTQGSETESTENSRLSKKEMKEDYQSLCKIMDEHFPYWGEVKDLGINKEEVYQKYEKLVEKAKNETEFYNDMGRMIQDLNKGQYGHFCVIGPAYYKELAPLYKKYVPDSPWVKTLTGEKTKELYAAYKEENSNFVPLGEKDNETEEKEQNESTEQSGKVTTKLLEKGAVGYIKIPSFEDQLMEENVPVIKEFIKKNHKIGNLIIDIRGNTGGNDSYWYDAIAEPNLKKAALVKMYYLFNQDLLTSSDTRDYVFYTYQTLNAEKKRIKELKQLSNPSPYVKDYEYFTIRQRAIMPEANDSPYEGRIWVLSDAYNYSAAASFTEFCKQSGFATLVGEAAGGDDCAMDPALFALPNSGLVVRFDLFYGINGDGSCNAVSGTIPDVSCKSKDALKVCLKEIKNQKK